MLVHSKIITNMLEGVYLIRAKDGIIVYTNPMFEKMFGYGHGEMLGKHVSVVNAPTDKDPIKTAKEITAYINKHGMWKGEILNIKKDGTHFWSYAVVSIIDHPEHGKVFVSAHTDITERKKAEEALKERIKELTAIYELSKLIETPGIKIEEVCHGLVQLIPAAWQYPEITCVRMVGEGCTCKTKNFKKTKWKQSAKIGGYGTVEVYYLEEKLKADEGPFLKEERNLINALTERFGKFIDQRKAEESLKKAHDELEERVEERTDELKESEEMYRNLYEQSTDMIQSMDVNGNIIEVNKSWLKVMGYTEKEVSKLNFQNIIHKSCLGHCEMLFKKIMAGKQVSNIDTIFVNKKGEKVYVAGSAQPIIKDGRTIRSWGYFRDVTEQKKADEALQKAKDELQNKVQELERFSDISVGRELKMVELKEKIKELQKTKTSD